LVKAMAFGLKLYSRRQSGVIWRGRERNHEPVEVGPRRPNTTPDTRRRHARRRCFLVFRQGRGEQDMVRSMAPKAIIFRHGQSRPGITPEAVYEVRADAIVPPALRLPQPSEQRPWISLYFQRRPGCRARRVNLG